ncbi:MAG: helix-hairpin-helix domain-containing protein, partial [Bacteroidales bacterium]|nr:helix-hairpin-helix domain-containing protein [Bacteroidales bacterium]
NKIKNTRIEEKEGTKPLTKRNNRDYKRNYKKDYQRDYKEKTWERTQNKEYEKPIYKKESIIIDINHADSLDFQALRGIGPVLSKRIIKYRNLLGGFVDINQIQEVYGISDSLFNTIKPLLRLDTVNIKQININQCDIKELNSHPYLDFYQSKAIIKYRQDKTHIDSIQELNLIQIIDPQTLNKLKPYIKL